MVHIPAPPEGDPRQSNPARETLLNIVMNLTPPPNYKLVLDVDKQTEKLRLRVLKREAYVIKFLGRVVWRYTQSWTNPEAEQRRMEARTYEALLTQLLAHPEFLEFEFVAEGSLAYRTAASI